MKTKGFNLVKIPLILFTKFSSVTGYTLNVYNRLLIYKTSTNFFNCHFYELKYQMTFREFNHEIKTCPKLTLVFWYLRGTQSFLVLCLSQGNLTVSVSRVFPQSDEVYGPLLRTVSTNTYCKIHRV